MGGFMDFMFGSPGEPSHTEFTTKSLLDSGQQNIQQQLEQILSGQLGLGVPSYPGTYTPGPTGNQSQIFQLIDSLLKGTGPLQQGGLSGLSSLMEPYSDTKAKNYWETALKTPALQNWKENTVPNIMEQFAAYDAAGSGPAMKAVAKSGEDLNTNLTSLLSKTLMDYEIQYKNRQLQATDMGLKYPTGLINSLLPGASQERQIQSEQLQEKYQDWLYEQPYNNPWLGLLPQVMNRQTFENMAYQAGGEPGQTGIFGQLLGAGAQLGSAWLRGPAPQSGASWFMA